jgi:predicted AlkP superfamily phosphohydrolase/phosphomutase
MSNDKRKVFCIGFDGATFDLIRPWVAAGKLPHLEKIMQDGVWGKLESVIPPISAPAWTSFMTGKNPGKHGIFGFTKQKQGSYEARFVNRKLIKSETLWKGLSDSGKKVIVINVPITYPPEEVDGCLVSGMDAPSTKSPYVYPPELREEINRVTRGKYRIHLHLGGYLINEKRKKEALEEIVSATANRTRVAEYLLQKKPWDFFMIKFDNPDQVQHYFWKEMNQEGSVFQNAILMVYQYLDLMLARLMRYMDENTNLLVVSDHGAGPLNGKRIYMNEWLRRNGMFFTKDHSDGKKRTFRSGFKVKKRLSNAFEKMYFGGGRIISYRVRNRLGISFSMMKARLRSFTSQLNTDWTKTKAYFGDNLSAIYINLEGREPNGIVKPGEEYEQVREKIIRGLESLVDPDDGKPVFDHVFRKEQVYQGPELERAPDILFFSRNFSDYTVGKEIFNDDKKHVIAYHPSPKGVTGNHRLDGIFLAQGKSIRKGGQVIGARILDICPTIYHMFGLEIPADIDGKSLTAIFTPEWLSQNPVRFSTMDSSIEETKAEVYSKEDEEEIRERLSGLGYI